MGENANSFFCRSFTVDSMATEVQSESSCNLRFDVLCNIFDKSASNDISAMNLRGVVDYLQAKGLMNISGLDSLIGRASDLFESKLGM